MSQDNLYTMVSSNYLEGLCAMVSEAIAKGWEPQGSPFRAEREGYPAQPQHWYQAMVRRPVINQDVARSVPEAVRYMKIDPLILSHLPIKEMTSYIETTLGIVKITQTLMPNTQGVIL